MTANDVWEMARIVLASVGGASVIILGLSSWLGKVWAERIYLRTSAKHTKEIEELKSRYNAELEHLRGEIAERRDFLSNLRDSLSTQYSLAHERILDSIEVLWSKVLEIRNLTSDALAIYHIFLSKEYENVPLEWAAPILPDMTEGELVSRLNSINADVERIRPFIGESLWMTYWLYSTFAGRIAYKVIRGKSVGKVYHWSKTDKGEHDESVFRLLQIIFPEDELKAVVGEIPIGAPQRIMSAFEAKMLDEMNELTFGRRFVSMSIEEQQRIASLMEPLKHLRKTQPNSEFNE